MDVANVRLREALHEERVLRFFRREVRDLDIADDRALGPFIAGIVIEIDLKYRARHLADIDIAEEDVLDGSAAQGIGLEAKSLVEPGAGETAVFNVDIAHASGHFAADGDAAVAIFHFAVADDHVFGGFGELASVAVTAGFDGDAVVAG